jgi:hypothetical protein
MLYGLILSLVFMAEWTHAGDAELTWTAPTQNTDGTPLTDLAGFKIYMGTTLGGPYPVSIDIADPTVTTFTVPNLSEGTYYFVTTAYNSASPVQESDFSNEATKTILPPVPFPPSDLTVVNLLVWDIVKQENKFVFLGVGTVPSGTPCDPTQTVNGRYAVPNAAVIWFGNVQPPVVVADCT